MSNEIKQGDKVRVAKDAPEMYIYPDSPGDRDCECIVKDTDGDNAYIEPKELGYFPFTSIIPTKYLVKVDAEAKEAKFKVGDKVVRKNVSTVRTIISIDYVDDDEDPAYYYNTVDSQGNNPMDFLESELILYTESTPKYKKGDRVKICSKNAARFGCVGTILEVYDNGTVDVDFNDYYVGGHLYSVDFIEPCTETTEQTEAEKKKLQNMTASELRDLANHGVSVGDEVKRRIKERDDKPNVGSIKIPVEVDLSGSYWDAYAADLAKEVALKVANKYNDPEQAAEYAVSVAKAVVEGLKRK